jgi:hypothetical protein
MIVESGNFSPSRNRRPVRHAQRDILIIIEDRNFHVSPLLAVHGGAADVPRWELNPHPGAAVEFTILWPTFQQSMSEISGRREKARS